MSELYKKYVNKSLILKVVMSIFSILVFYFLTRKFSCKSIIKCEAVNIAILFILIIIDYILNKIFVFKKEISRNKYAISTIIFLSVNIISIALLFIFIKKHLIIKYIISTLLALISYEVCLIKINKRINMVKTFNVIFVSIFFIILSLGTYTIIGEKQMSSLIENRGKKQFEIPTVKSFKNKTYQDNLENALADQFKYSTKIKEMSVKYLNFLDYNKINKNICSGRYVKVASNYATYDCGDYILNVPKNVNTSSAAVKKKISVLSSLNDYVDTYYYAINRAYTINFEKDEMTFNIEDFLKENLTGDYKIKSLNNFSYENYTKYFYKTDHHWNYKGSYKGYKEIHDLLELDDDYLEPSGILESKYKFFGSHAKLSKMFVHGDDFKYYSFDYKEHATYLNGEIGLYTNTNRKIKEKYSNFYQVIYGGDGYDLLYNFDEPEKDNLLIIATSFSNPINEMIASHFNKTYVIDLRTMRNGNDSPVNLKEYVRWHDIDKVLVIVSTDVMDNAQLKMDWKD